MTRTGEFLELALALGITLALVLIPPLTFPADVAAALVHVAFAFAFVDKLHSETALVSTRGNSNVVFNRSLSVDSRAGFWSISCVPFSCIEFTSRLLLLLAPVSAMLLEREEKALLPP